MRHTSGHSGNRRSHHGISAPRLSLCEKCGSEHMRHRMCGQCGTYRGREVVDVLAKMNKKAERAKRKARELGEETHDDSAEKKPQKGLSPEELSKN